MSRASVTVGSLCAKHVPDVMEGYSVDRTAPVVVQGTHIAARDPVADSGQIFQSARDINHRLLKDWTPSPFSSPKKRTRYDYEAGDALEDEDGDVNMEIDPKGTNLQTRREDYSQRPIKPLRRTLFSDTFTIPKPTISQNRVLHADHSTSRSENPFLE